MSKFIQLLEAQTDRARSIQAEFQVNLISLAVEEVDSLITDDWGEVIVGYYEEGFDLLFELLLGEDEIAMSNCIPSCFRDMKLELLGDIAH